MGNTNITKLTFRNECLRVAVDRKEPWFFTDDIVALADIEDKASAMEKSYFASGQTGRHSV